MPFGVDLGFSSSSSSGTRDTNYNRTGTHQDSTRVYTPEDWMTRYNGTFGQIGPAGMTPDQQTGMQFLRQNLNDPRMGDAYGAATRRSENAEALFNRGTSALMDYSSDGANTLGKWFPGQITVNAASSSPTSSVTAGTGASRMDAYRNPYQKDVVDASLAMFDENRGEQEAAMKAQAAAGGALANKRYGLTEAKFRTGSDMARAQLGSNLLSQGFTTAAGLGMADADRSLSADSTNAANMLANNQFNAQLAQQAEMATKNLLDSRQKYDLAQADKWADRRSADTVSALNAAGVNAGIGTNLVGSAIGVNNAGVGNASAIGNYGNMTTQQLLDALRLGTATFGSDSSGTDTETGEEHEKTKGKGKGFAAGFSGGNK